MIFIKADKLDDEQIDLLYELHRDVYKYTGLLDEFNKLLSNIYVLTEPEIFEIKGYIQVGILSNDTVKVEWIYGPGYGKLIMTNIEYHFKLKGYNKIVLDIAINPNELKEAVMKRLNFYIKNKYKVYDIEFRTENGPVLKMEKILDN
jgi:hypothetical protein